MLISTDCFHVVASALLLLMGSHVIGAQSATTNNDTGNNSKDGSDSTLNDRLPVVNLGYARYRATALNQSGQYYNFSNIRYAAPPLGELRWRDPAPPLPEEHINNGSLGFTCPQSLPSGYLNPALLPVLPYIAPGISGQNQSEDCLFLDVISPVKLFEQGQRSQAGKDKLVPVLVNIHGGGFFEGDKTAIYWPGGLLERGHNGFVYVSMNYRLSAFGFLSSLEPSAANTTSPNAGLMDQRAALKWVQRYIHLFGGDAAQVTLTGQSAGGSSIQYHSIAYGGSKPEENALFIRANVQSPGTLTQYPKYAELSANLFLHVAGVTSVDAARKLSTDVLMHANAAAQAQTPFNVAYFAPIVDGDLIPDIPPRAYNNGQFIKNISFMTSNEQNEARLLGNQSILTNSDFDNWVTITFPSITTQQRSYIINTLYPPIYNGSYPYSNPFSRSQLATKEYLISCNSYILSHAYSSHLTHTYNYIFSLAPAIHSQDLAYTYYPTPDGSIPNFNPGLAVALQKYIVNFVMTGDPNDNGNGNGNGNGSSSKSDLPHFPVTTQQGHALNFTAGGIEAVISDAFGNERCAFWAEGAYFPEVK